MDCHGNEEILMHGILPQDTPWFNAKGTSQQNEIFFKAAAIALVDPPAGAYVWIEAQKNVARQNQADAENDAAIMASIDSGGTPDTISPGLRISTYRLTKEGETFIRYESADPAYTRITPSGGVKPNTFAAPASDGIIPLEDRVPVYNLPSPEISRPNVKILTPPAGTPIIGPRPVEGGTGNEVEFPMGFE